MTKFNSSGSIANYKRNLFYAVSEYGFISKGDISVKDLNSELRAQVVTTGNAYFLSIIMQISMPSSADFLSENILRFKNKRFNSENVYNPVFSVEFNHTDVDDEGIIRSINEPNWEELNILIDKIADHISMTYINTINLGIQNQKFWWPRRLGINEISMLYVYYKISHQNDMLIVLRNGGFFHANDAEVLKIFDEIDDQFS